MFDRFINSEFTSYLNRYFTGIIELKEKIEKISVFFELSEAFSNHACRFYIDITFINDEDLSEEDIRMANKFFYNSSNSTGSKFVSFIYQSQRSFVTDVEEVRSFIYHYQFAQNLFEGFIKSLLPEKCTLDIVLLETEPFFNYIQDFFIKSRYSKEEHRSFDREYLKTTGREFSFDCRFHDGLISASSDMKGIEEYAVVSDKELHDAGGGGISDIRRYVVENKVPFSVRHYSHVIDKIWIDSKMLAAKMVNYIPDNYTVINRKPILNLLERKQNELMDRTKMIKEKSDILGIKLGDYVYVEGSYYESDSQDIGVVKEIRLNYSNQLEIKYNVLKKDLSESRLALKSTAEMNIAHTLTAKIFQEAVANGVINTKVQVIRLFKDKGVRNPMFKAKKKGK
jgi:hypothetical protein